MLRDPGIFLHSFFGPSEVLVELVVIEMGENTHDVWHTVIVQQAQELKSLHLETD